MGSVIKFMIAALVALALSGCSSLPKHKDEICSNIVKFAKAPMDSGQTKRSITLYWFGDWMDFENGFGKACKHKPDDASTSFCNWLPDNTSTEFANGTPMRILECFGYSFPTYSRWSNRQSSIVLWGTSDEPILLEVDLKPSPEHDRAIRITVFADGHGVYDDDFKPLIKPKE